MSKPGPPPGAMRLTKAQQALWASQLLHPDTPLYNMAFSFTIDGAIDEAAFAAAFADLVEDVDTLRTVVASVDGVPYQVVQPSLEFDLPVVEMADAAAAADWAQQRCTEPLDISRRSFDSALLRLATDQYVWYLCQHHVVADAAAFAVVYERMADLYAAALHGDEVPPNPVPAFANYVAYENSVAEPEDPETMPPPAPALYGANPAGGSTRNERVTLELSDTARLRDLALAPGVRALTPDLGLFQLLVTAFIAFLHRVSGQTAITIGAPVHNRSSAEFKRAAGLFMEVYPLGVDVAPDDTFASLYAKVRAATATFMRSAKPGWSTTDANRRINAVLNYITARFGPFDGMPVSAVWLHPNSVDGHHQLRLQVHDFSATGQLSLGFDCSTDAFPPEVRAAMPGHFAKLVAAMIGDWDSEIGAVDLLGEAERSTVVSAVNDSTVDSFAGATVVDEFLSRSQENPDATAMSHGDRTWTYRDMERISAALAAGISPGTVVGIALTRSPAAVLALLGVLRAGAAYVPIDPTWPRERARFVVEDANCSLVIGNPSQDLGVATVDFEDAVANEPGEERSCSRDDLAYILYTSGSTGQPKGVMIEHGSLANYVAWAGAFYGCGQRLAFPLFTPLTFDLTVTSIFVPLTTGGTIRVYEETSERGDLAVLDVFADDSVDIVKLTPSHLALLPERPPAPARIQQLILGGEDLTVATARRAHERFAGSVSIHNEYGPTEATVGCIVHTYDPQTDVAGSVPIGRPITGMRAYVLDAGGNPVPFGVPGELHVAGVGVARGYAGRPDLTTARFNQNGRIEEHRAYATGDMARVRPDGIIEYLGRRDDQVKIRGVRVELGEIEAAVASHPDVVAATANVWLNDADAADRALVSCVRCGLSSDYPGISFDQAGVCSECASFESYRDRAQIYFKPEEELLSILRSQRAADSDYDCLALLSGGKDSTYVLGRLVDMGVRVLAFTLDNGYISEQAKGNIRRVVSTLGVDHVFATTPAMNEIFVDSLQRHANVCNGCYKAIYTLSMQTALEKRIPFIVTGLSRGQFFETRLTKELFTDLAVDSDQIDANVLEVRKAYHRVDDAVRRLLDVSAFDDDDVFDRVRFVDFYRYVDVGLDEIYSYLDERVPWVRPTDTGRSTNCLINDVGIYYHRKVRGYHNYSLPYSWDVRMGHKTREEALEELDDEIDVAGVARILDEIGFPGDIADYESGQRLISYYVAPVDIPTPVLKDHVAAKLPHQVVPAQFVRLDTIPLTANGKVDKAALPAPDGHPRTVDTVFVAARTEVEATLVAIWEEVIGVAGIGVNDNYFDLGGDSIMAIQIMARANGAGLALELPQLFEAQTVAGIAATLAEEVSATAISAELPEIAPDQMEQLASVLKRLDGGQ